MKKLSKIIKIVAIFSIVVFLLIFLLRLKGIYKNYIPYSSENSRFKIGLVFSFLKGYIFEFEEIPSVKTYFDFIRNDTNYIEGHFPNFEFPNIDPSDFVITTDYNLIHVWLFEPCKPEEDTLYLGDLTFANFIKRESHLVAEFTYPDPCRPEMIHIQKNRKTVIDTYIKNKLLQIIFDFKKIQTADNNNEHDWDLCCFLVYFTNGTINVEHLQRFHTGPCQLDNQLYSELTSRLSFLVEYSEYEFYIQLYIDRNRMGERN